MVADDPARWRLKCANSWFFRMDLGQQFDAADHVVYAVKPSSSSSSHWKRPKDASDRAGAVPKFRHGGCRFSRRPIWCSHLRVGFFRDLDRGGYFPVTKRCLSALRDRMDR
jgi:hypothetical protein